MNKLNSDFVMSVHFLVISDGIFGYTVLPLFGHLKLSYRQIGEKNIQWERKTKLTVILKSMIVS